MSSRPVRRRMSRTEQTNTGPSGTPGERPAVSETRRSWKGISVVRFSQVVEEVIAPASAGHSILVNVGPPFALEEKLEGRYFSTPGMRGDVAVVPGGATMGARAAPGRGPQKVESFLMRLDVAFLREIAAGAGIDPDGIEVVGSLGGRDPAIEQIGASLLSEVENDGLLGDLYAGSLAASLVVQLLRNHSSLGRAAVRGIERRPYGGLPKATLRRVTDYVGDNLDRGITLADLSGVAHMSPFHFSRMFKTSTGLSPHRYVIQRRVERARELLTLTDLPLHEVARLSGFTDQSHLARHTRRLLGASPRALRLASG